MKHTQSKGKTAFTARARRKRLNRQLLGYTATAGAALAVAGVASAEIISNAGYSGPITVNASNPSVGLNLHGGGGTDFNFFFSSGGSYGNVLGGNAFGGAGLARYCLIAGAPINPSAMSFYTAITGSSGFAWRMKTSSGSATYSGGHFLGQRGYIGVRFADPTNPEQLNYGWIDFEANSDVTTGTIYGWAYDNTGAGIGAGQVPEPSSLALCALGALTAAGAAVLRRWNKAA